ncbi:glycosyltransferase [Candidatus Collierbacteria bacterium]|nr:glycosyltransferase [Candidatus Collierbacteria bacterium]
MKTEKEIKTFLLTGAHITPAVALAQEIFSRIPNARVIYCGRKKFNNGKDSIEEEEIARVGGEFIPIEFAKLNRFISMSTFTEFFKIPTGLFRGLQLIKRINPDVVVSFGGYISIPIVVAAKISGIPIIVHEQTLVWGLANKISRFLATSTAVSWPEAMSGKSVLTGNPIPKEIIMTVRKSKPDVLFISGGSQGSMAINRLIDPILPELTKHFIVYHQTGCSVNRSINNYFPADWFPTPIVADIFRRTKIAVSRSGANTVTYLSYFGIPSILIPLPFSGGGEQSANADALRKTGLVTVFKQQNLTSEMLLNEILRINQNYSKIQEQSLEKARQIVISDAASRLADLIFRVL